MSFFVLHMSYQHSSQGPIRKTVFKREGFNRGDFVKQTMKEMNNQKEQWSNWEISSTGNLFLQSQKRRGVYVSRAQGQGHLTKARTTRLVWADYRNTEAAPRQREGWRNTLFSPFLPASNLLLSVFPQLSTANCQLTGDLWKHSQAPCFLEQSRKSIRKWFESK